MTKKTPKPLSESLADKSFSEVQAERRARGGDSATLADLEERLIIKAIEVTKKSLNPDAIALNLKLATKAVNIWQAKSRGGAKHGYGKTHPEPWAAAVAFYRVEYENGPLKINGDLKKDSNRPTRFYEAMQPHVKLGAPDYFASSLSDFGKKASLTVRNERLNKK